MPPSQNSSFIPKHNPKSKPRGRASKSSSTLVFTIVGAVFGSVIIVSGALIFYEWYLGNQFNRAVTELNQVSNSFSEANLSRVEEFDNRLKAASRLFDEHISITRVLSAVSELTVTPVQYAELSIAREDRSSVRVTGSVQAEDLGAIVAQRNTYESGDNFSAVLFEDLQMTFASNEAAAPGEQLPDNEEQLLGITVNLEFPIEAVLYEGASVRNTNFGSGQGNAPATIMEEVSDVNNENI